MTPSHTSRSWRANAQLPLSSRCPFGERDSGLSGVQSNCGTVKGIPGSGDSFQNGELKVDPIMAKAVLSHGSGLNAF